MDDDTTNKPSPSPPPPPAAAGGGEGRESAVPSPPQEGEALTVLTDALGQVLRLAVRRGRRELSRAAAAGRVRMELRQLRQDRQRMFEKLGREVVNLVEAGELRHPGLLRGAERIQQLDAQIAEVEAEVAAARERAGGGADDKKDLAPGGDPE